MVALVFIATLISQARIIWPEKKRLTWIRLDNDEVLVSEKGTTRYPLQTVMNFIPAQGQAPLIPAEVNRWGLRGAKLAQRLRTSLRQTRARLHYARALGFGITETRADFRGAYAGLELGMKALHATTTLMNSSTNAGLPPGLQQMRPRTLDWLEEWTESVLEIVQAMNDY